ncbi:MAG: ABC transporter permease [Crocinitomicaceae bacterium]|nr:ABC transporter permease [Crocinitomicaceae bacterium]
MKTIIKIAWRNVWRNRLRSFVVFASVMLGVWAGLFTVSLTLGMMDQQKRSIVQTQTSHLKVHSSRYMKDEKLINHIPDDTLELLENQLKNDSRVVAYTERTIIDGTVNNAHGFANLKIVGIDPEMEKTVTTIYERLDSGTYFSEFKNRPVLVGKSLADDLKLDVGKSLNLNFMDKDTNAVGIGFKVEGVFNSGNGTFDKQQVFVRQNDLNELLQTNHFIHEIAIICTDIKEAEPVRDEINSKLGGSVEARTWAQLSPQLAYSDEMMTVAIFIILGIIIFALAFGILNTMLMAVLERKRELGMLLCVGMNKRKVFFMIMIETIFLSFVAAPLGLLLSWITVTYFGSAGINLMDVGDAMYQFGYDALVYPKLYPYVYFMVSTMIIGAAIISSIIPARRALKYNPAEAVRAL